MRVDCFLYPQARKKAMTFSFDDGVVVDRKLVPMLEKYSVKGTFNISSGCFGKREAIPGSEMIHEVITEKEVLNLYKNMEISAHGYHHLSMTDCPPDSALSEAVLDRVSLESLTGRQIRGFAYPYGDFSPESEEGLKKAGFHYSRTTVDTHSFDLPANFMEWNPTCHIHDPKRDELLDEFLSLQLSPFSKNPVLFYIWGHSFELALDNSWNEFDNFLKKASEKEDVWYASNGEIEEYITAIKRLEYTADRTKIYNPSARDVWIEIEDKPVRIKGGSAYVQGRQ